MNFLFWAFLAGTAAVAFPLLFHLIRRTPKGRQDFSATMFLTESPPRLTRRSRLDNLLLLLLRAAVIVLLALAFMRPFWRAEETLADPPGRRVAVLVDMSASMKRGDLWQQALAHASKTLDSLESDDDVALFAFDDRLRPLVPFASTASDEDRAKNRSIVREKLKDLSPSWGHTDLGAALVATADALVAASDAGKAVTVPAAAQIVVISDAQSGAKLDALSAFEWPKDVQVDLRAVVLPKSSNARVALLDDEASAIAAQQPKARVTSGGDSAIEQFRVAWAKPNAGERDINAAAVAFYVPPGQSRVLAVPRAAEQADADRLVLVGDDEPFDNAFYVAPQVQREIRVTWIGRDKADDAQQMRYYFARALAETPRRKVMIDWREPESDLASLVAERPHLVCITDAVAAAPREVLEKYVAAGGTVLAVLRDVETANSLSALIAASDAREIGDASKQKFAMWGQIDFAHPLFAQFSSAKFSDFTKLRFWRRRSVKLDAAVTPPAQVIARFDDGGPAIWERSLGKGRVIALASGWHPRDSQWALSTKFLPMISGLADRVGPRDPGGTTLAVHKSIALPMPDSQGATSAVQRTVKKPDGAQVAIAGDATTFDGTDQPGVYRVTAGEETWSFAVNLAPRESDTVPFEAARLDPFGIKLGMQLSSSEAAARDRQLRDTELEGRQKIWKWLIVAALVVLGMETLLAGWRAAAPAVPQGEPA